MARKQGHRSALLFLDGALVGGLITFLGMTLAQLPGDLREPFVLTRDLDLEAAYAFHGSNAPQRGTVQAGSEGTITWRKGSVSYIKFETAVQEDTLSAVSNAPNLRLQRTGSAGR